MNRDLTPWPPLHRGEGEEPAGHGGEREELAGHGGEGEEPTGHGGVVRKQKINPEKLEIAREFRKNPTESEDAVWQILNTS